MRKSSKTSFLDFRDLYKKEHFLKTKQITEKIDFKIKKLASNKMVIKHVDKFCDHLIKKPSASIILKLFFDLLGKSKFPTLYEEKKIEIKPFKHSNKKAPIGIKGPNWINALMQFIIHIPSILNIFDFAPKSFLPFNVFIDCYQQDRKNLSELSISSEILFECLYRKVSKKFINNYGRIDIYKILKTLISLIIEKDEKNFENDEKNISFLSFHPEWQITIDSDNRDFESYIENTLALNKPKEILISYKWFSKGRKKRFSSRMKPKKNIFINNFFYELDAFIEYREDDFFMGNYITYLKIDNEWYQCEDSKIKKIESNNLFIPLLRSILLHYKLIYLNQRLIYRLL